MVVKAAVVAAVMFVSVACGDSTSPAAAPDTNQAAASPSAYAATPDTTQAAASPSTSAAATLTPVDSPSPVAAKTAVTFLNAPLTVKRGSNATLQVRTAANTACSIEVDYKSGPSTAAGLVAKNSDGAGDASWTWKVGASTTPGAWPITVTCGGGSARTQITVT